MTDWRGRWQEGRTSFHRDEVNPDLQAHADRFLGDTPRRVLVPLCGKSVDMRWLADRGQEVVGVELVEQAIDEWHAENNVTPEVASDGELRVYRSPNITLYQGDFFALTPEQVHADRVWDRAALIALPEDKRGAYAAHLRSLLMSDWLLLQSTVEYDRAIMDGPPYSVDAAEMASLYAGAHVEQLHHIDIIADAQRWRDRGHKYWVQAAYLVTPS